MLAQHLVSIIMPAYNAANFIREAIESVIKQDYDAWELLVVNDGSTDNTESIIRSFIDNRIQYIVQKNKGVSAARNKAMAKAKGSFFLFLDADDVLSRNSISSRIKKFAGDPMLGIVDGIVVVKDQNLETELRQFKPIHNGRIVKKLAYLSEEVFCMPSAMVKRETALEYKFDERMSHSEDIWFLLNTHNRSKLKYGYVDNVVLTYRRPTLSAMSNLSGLAKGYILFYDHVKDHRILNKLELVLLKIKILKVMLLSFIKANEFAHGGRFIVQITSH